MNIYPLLFFSILTLCTPKIAPLNASSLPHRSLDASSCVSCLQSGMQKWCTDMYSRSSGECCALADSAGGCSSASNLCSNSGSIEASSEYLFCPEHFNACGDQEFNLQSKTSKAVVETENEFSESTVCWYQVQANAVNMTKVKVTADFLEEAEVEVFYSDEYGDFDYVSRLREGETIEVGIEKNKESAQYVYVLVQSTSSTKSRAVLTLKYSYFTLSTIFIVLIVLASFWCYILFLMTTTTPICCLLKCLQGKMKSLELNQSQNPQGVVIVNEVNQYNGQGPNQNPTQSKSAPQPNHHIHSSFKANPGEQPSTAGAYRQGHRYSAYEVEDPVPVGVPVVPEVDHNFSVDLDGV